MTKQSYRITVSGDGQLEMSRPKNECGEKSGVHIDVAIEAIGTGRFHTLLLAVCGASLLALVTEAINIGFVVPSAKCEIRMTTGEQGLLLSMSFLGIVVSSHLWGFLTDTWGRKASLQLALATGFAFSSASAFAPSVGWLIGLRFITGFCISGIQSASLVYLGEFHGHRTRARAVTLASMCMVLALVFIALVALAVLPIPIRINVGPWMEFRSWRLDILVCGLVLLLAFAGACGLPESPQFLMAMGREDEALAALQFAYAWNTGNVSKAFPYTQIHTDQVGRSLRGITVRESIASVWQQTWPVFAHPLWRNTALMCYLSFVLFLIAHGMNTWLPHIFHVLWSQTSDQPLTMCAILTRFVQIKINATQETVNAPNGTICMDRSDPIVLGMLLAYTAGCMAIFIVVVCVMRLIDLKLLLIAWLALSAVAGLAIIWISNFAALLLLVTIFLSCGNCGCIMVAIAQDMFPVNIRAMALCVIFMMGRVGSVLGSNIIGAMLDRNCDGILFAYAMALLSCVGMCFFLPRTNKVAER